MVQEGGGSTSWDYPKGHRVAKERVTQILENERVRADLTEYEPFFAYYRNAEQFFRLRLWGSERIKEAVAKYPMVTDDYPFTEFPLWRHGLRQGRIWIPTEQFRIQVYREQLAEYLRSSLKGK